MTFNILLQITALLIGTTGTEETTRDQYPTAATPVIKFSDTTDDKVEIYLKNGNTSTLSGEYAIPATNGQALIIKSDGMHTVSGSLADLDGTHGIATITCAQNFKVSFDNQNAYAATASVDGSALKLTKVQNFNANMVFAAGTGLVLYGSKGANYTITPVSDNPTASISTNVLKGTVAHTTPAILQEQNPPAQNQELLLLFYNKTGIAFQPYNGTYIPQGKAFVPMFVTTQANSRSISLDIVSDPTALDEVTIDKIEIIDDATYDLSGSTVNEATSGIIINNGKLYIIK